MGTLSDIMVFSHHIFLYKSAYRPQIESSRLSCLVVVAISVAVQGHALINKILVDGEYSGRNEQPSLCKGICVYIFIYPSKKSETISECLHL